MAASAAVPATSRKAEQAEREQERGGPTSAARARSVAIISRRRS
jgi:hypothetical protein